MTSLPRTPSLRLDGRRAFVTGASRGIGLGAAVALCEAGAHVVIAARNRVEVEAAATAITDAGVSSKPSYSMLLITKPCARSSRRRIRSTFS